MKATTIHPAIGVLIPLNRITPVAATAFASLSKLAPGRIDFGFVVHTVRPLYITATTTITGSEDEITATIAGLAASGYSEIAIQIVPGQEHPIED